MSKNNKNFFFKDQTKDNIFGPCAAVPIWTAFEVFSLWAFANGYFIGLEWIDHPEIYLGLTFLIIPLFEVHFLLCS